MPAAATSAAVLGSRSARRQMKSVLAIASEAGAYSVGFSVVRGGLTGFSVYLAGDFAGACKGIKGAAAFNCAVPHASKVATNVHAPPVMGAHAAAAAPAPPAAPRKRGCRAGAKVQQRRRQGARERPSPMAPTATATAPLEGGTSASPSRGNRIEKRKPAASRAPPLHNTTTTNTAQPSSSLSPLAPTFVPPPPPPFPPPSSTTDVPHDLLHLLPHARLSYEELRWDHYRAHGGGLLLQHSKKRATPPSPSWGSPPSSIVGCVVNERRPRATPPPPPTPSLPAAREH